VTICEWEIGLCLRLTISLSLRLRRSIVLNVARQRVLTPQQVFSCCRQARQPLTNTESKAPQFVPAIVETALPPTVLR
jgi:hypothetical protein